MLISNTINLGYTDVQYMIPILPVIVVCDPHLFDYVRTDPINSARQRFNLNQPDLVWFAPISTWQFFPSTRHLFNVKFSIMPFLVFRRIGGIHFSMWASLVPELLHWNSSQFGAKKFKGDGSIISV